jgi:tetratricopeptide (TPR) repeat protein
MAAISKKDKLIEEAQKCASRGQFGKAVKAYEQIVALEPSTISLRQKLAELLIKCARNDDARKELEKVAAHFSKNGFYLKAIAVYKQLQKLFPADISLCLTLAELNEKHGLVQNALTEYKFVYEQYETSGDIPEALNILDRMQIVDPLNIPVKIKLAEAYAQHGKIDEGYAVFLKTAVLLIERSDNQALAKVCARVQQLFPEKKDFLFEVLSELIRMGNAAAAIGSLQNLLRSDPGNKVVWELIIQAYQLLDQPQRVKMAYQHYLKYFPEEPVAIVGLLTSITAERNLAAALEMLDKYESTLISAGFLQHLEQIYQDLDTIDPINTKVLEGLIRVATATGKEDDRASHIAKLTSLRTISRGTHNVSPEPEPANFVPGEEALEDVFSAALSTTPPLLGEEVEIEIEVDTDADFDSSSTVVAEATGDSSVDENWLDSVVALFDAIDSTPRGVKFGIEMENSDARSHFDLGQAFKEMGLFDEALNEFRQASQDHSLRLECLILQCVCLRERGEYERATTILQALLKCGLSEEECCAVKYELATGYEFAGKTEEARVLLNEINVTHPGFRDVDSRLNAVSTLHSLDFSEEDLDDFGLK